VEVVGAGEEESADQQILPYTPNAVAVVRWVRKEAERVRPEAIGTEHVLRAALRRRDSLAVRVLEDCAVDASGLANKLKRARPHDEFRDGALADAVLTIQLDRSKRT
jgi:ATP-dependent Clp protease ATP-binding subunit ClpA